MAAEIWILLIIVISALAAGAGFAFARRGVPNQSEIDALQQELDEARQQATAVQDNVTGHFEQSALLFGRLAQDYRAFLEHFSASARDLGIDEVAARELLERADLPLLGNNSDVIDADLGAPTTSEQPDAQQINDAEEAEPPLMEDMVVPGPSDDDVADGPLEGARSDATTVASTVVDVELEPQDDGDSTPKTQQAS